MDFHADRAACGYWRSIASRPTRVMTRPSSSSFANMWRGSMSGSIFLWVDTTKPESRNECSGRASILKTHPTAAPMPHSGWPPMPQVVAEMGDIKWICRPLATTTSRTRLAARIAETWNMSSRCRTPRHGARVAVLKQPEVGHRRSDHRRLEFGCS